ncbi:MAG: Tm-1-like ATP-binding domain-containing protein [Spirochaetaceae bacterium]
MKPAYVIGTCDTKYRELSYVAERLHEMGVPTVLVDVGSTAHGHPVDVTNEEVAAYHPRGERIVGVVDDRGEAVRLMSEALSAFLPQRTDLGGVIGLGGSGGTALVAAAMRRLPIGVPKVMVSTVASGDVAPYVGPNDIAMVYSVTDVAGINRISRTVLGNAAHAVAGMIMGEIPPVEAEKPAVGMTMFGVTTPAVTAVREQLEEEYDVLVFHATGTGGQSMEKLADSGMLAGIIDVTTTEVCDLFMGGVMSAGEDRFGAVIRTGLPYIGSTGALDMVNFGAKDTVPEKYRDRNLYVHNPQVTLMRTTPEENRRMGEWIAGRLNQAPGPVRFLIPEKGVSLIDAPGQPFYDPEADAELFAAIERVFEQTGQRKLIKLPYNVNDPEFAAALVANFRELLQSG